MAKYSIQANDTADNTLANGGVVVGSQSRRVKIYDLVFGSEATPADNIFLWTVDRGNTGPGTSSAVTPSPFDMADAAANSTAGENYTVNPTLGVNLLAIPLNQRATFRWVASPGSELVMPGAANSSIVTRTPTGPAVVVTMTMLFSEE